MEKMKVLTVTSYGENEGESYRVTLNPGHVEMVTSSEVLVNRRGMNLFKACVQFHGEDGGGAELYITGDDLRILEEAIGFYGFDD